jgi:hypothetical protein
MPNLTITAEEEVPRWARGFLGVEPRVLSSGRHPSRDELHDRTRLPLTRTSSSTRATRGISPSTSERGLVNPFATRPSDPAD